MRFDALVIGGGPAGLAAAIAAARRGRHVCLLESTERVGRKILASGNGKCNLGSRPFDFGCYNDPEFVKQVYQTVSPEAVYAFLQGCGVYLRLSDGRLYPYSRQASTVLNALRTCAEGAGVQTRVGNEVVQLTGRQGAFRAVCANGSVFEADRVMLACGSPAAQGTMGAQLAVPFGHSLRSFQPALCPVCTELEPIRGLRGLRFLARVTLVADGRTRGVCTEEVLVKDNGLSGTAIFALSSCLARHHWHTFELHLDLVPELSLEELRAAHRTYPLTAFFHREIAKKLESTPDPVATAKDWIIRGRSAGNFDLAQVASGGLQVREFDETLRSRLCSGLYAAGEVLDVDGGCGGYNLTWAFASGLLVGGNL